MKISEVRLKSFRNIRELRWKPSDRLNFLIGGNGEGKTSILEAIAYLSSLRSFRESSVEELVMHSAASGSIDATLEWKSEPESSWKTEFSVLISRLPDSGRWTRQASINGKPYRSSLSYVSQRFHTQHLGFHAVVFNPADHDLIRGAPAVRRQYLDRTIAAESASSLQSLQRYRRLLEQRNALLKQEPFPLDVVLQGFTEALAKAAAEVTFARLKWLHEVSGPLLQQVRIIAPLQQKLGLAYHSKWLSKNQEKSSNNNTLLEGHFAGQSPLPSLNFLESEFLRQIRFFRDDERRAGATLVGPHRDDWGFVLGGTPLQGYGSQGEVRSVLLALKLAELELFQKATGHLPVFLLDDFSSELDSDRREYLLRMLEQTPLQVFVTTTEDRFERGKRFKVQRGELLQL